MGVTIRTTSGYCQLESYVHSEVTSSHNEVNPHEDNEMRWFDSYVDELKEKLKLPSDYAVAKFLGIPRQSMTKVRNGAVLGHDKCLRIAIALKKDPVEVIATAEAQKEKNKDLKAIWVKLAKERGNE